MIDKKAPTEEQAKRERDVDRHALDMVIARMASPQERVIELLADADKDAARIAHLERVNNGYELQITTLRAARAAAEARAERISGLLRECRPFLKGPISGFAGKRLLEKIDAALAPVAGQAEAEGEAHAH